MEGQEVLKRIVGGIEVVGIVNVESRTLETEISIVEILDHIESLFLKVKRVIGTLVHILSLGGMKGPGSFQES